MRSYDNRILSTFVSYAMQNLRDEMYYVILTVCALIKDQLNICFTRRGRQTLFLLLPMPWDYENHLTKQAGEQMPLTIESKTPHKLLKPLALYCRVESNNQCALWQNNCKNIIRTHQFTTHKCSGTRSSINASIDH